MAKPDKAKAPPPSAEAPATQKTTFAMFASSLEPALANALRVFLRIADVHAIVEDVTTLRDGLRTLLGNKE